MARAARAARAAQAARAARAARLARSGWVGAVLFFALLAFGCSVGTGQGQVEGEVFIADCIEAPTYRMDPNFFSADELDGRENIRIQRGSYVESFSDGMLMHIGDVNTMQQSQLGLPLEIDQSPDSPVHITLHLNETCPSGFPDSYRTPPVIMEAHAGTITFDSVFAPEVASGATEISATFEGLTFENPERPEEWHAVLHGWFTFFYQRGQPAQRFP